MSDPTPPIKDAAMRLHAVRFPDGTMYQCGFPTSMEAESFREARFGPRVEGKTGEVVPIVAVPEAEHVERLALIADLYAELQEIDFPEHGGRRPFFDPRDVELENRIRKAIGMPELPPPPPLRFADDNEPAQTLEQTAAIFDEAMCGSVKAVADSIDGALARRFAIQR